MLYGLLLLSLVLTACQASTPLQPLDDWSYSDLRGLDPVDAPSPEMDLVAAYLRSTGEEWQVRLDLLEMGESQPFDLYLLLDHQPGGAAHLRLFERGDKAALLETDIEWDTLLYIPTHGSIQTIDTDLRHRPQMGVRVLRDPISDFLTISFRRSALKNSQPKQLRFQAFLIPVGKVNAADRSPALGSGNQPPAQARMLLVFWNTYPAYTPLQALRRWDGAHTGPLGGRHGLYNLLRAVRNTQTPVALLDLKLPASLAALDYQGGLKLVRDLADKGLLILPEALPGFDVSAEIRNAYRLPDSVLERAYADRRQSSQAFGLKSSPFLYAPWNQWGTFSDARLVFTPLPESPKGDDEKTFRGSVTRYRQQRVVWLPGNGNEGWQDAQATLDGPSLAVRRALLDAALAAGRGETAIVVLGGDLPVSHWGNPQAARETLQYLRAHPWVRPLNAHDLLSLAPDESLDLHPRSGQQSNLFPAVSVENFDTNTANLIADAARQAYFALLSPVYPAPPELLNLRSEYAGQIDVLKHAAQWAEAPSQISDCNVDPDGDGQEECLLSESGYFTLFELEGGCLAYAFVRDEAGVLHQVIGPSSQLISGMSEARTWQMGSGLLSDPQVLPCAFFNPGDPSADGQPERYRPDLHPGKLILTAPDGKTIKTFSMRGGHELKVEIRSEGPIRVEIPLILDPWQRFSPDWTGKYQEIEDEGILQWRSADGFSVRVVANGHMQADTFLDSQTFIGEPENPNRDYPPGHRLPFPMAFLEISGEDMLEVSLVFVK